MKENEADIQYFFRICNFNNSS